MTTTATKNALAEHHRALDAHLNRLVARAKLAPPQELRAEWTVFERELLHHLELEETEILPAFAKHDAAEVQALLGEHTEIRNALLELGVNLDLHCLRAEAVEDFVGALRRHAEREDAALYGWAEAHVESGAWQRIKRALTSAAANGRKLARLADRVM